MDNIQQYIVDWVKTDKQLKQLNKESGDLRKQKDTIQCNLLPLIQENNLQEYSKNSIDLFYKSFTKEKHIYNMINAIKKN